MFYINKDNDDRPLKSRGILMFETGPDGRLSIVYVEGTEEKARFTPTDHDIQCAAQEFAIRRNMARDLVGVPLPPSCVCPESPCPVHSGKYESQAAPPFGKGGKSK